MTTLPPYNEMKFNLEFTGGAEFLFGNQKSHQVVVPRIAHPFTIKVLIRWIGEVMLKDCDTPEMFIEGDSLRPGILVLINECDWELLNYENTELKDGDLITFISTLHGG